MLRKTIHLEGGPYIDPIKVSIEDLINADLSDYDYDSLESLVCDVEELVDYLLTYKEEIEVKMLGTD